MNGKRWHNLKAYADQGKRDLRLLYRMARLQGYAWEQPLLITGELHVSVECTDSQLAALWATVHDANTCGPAELEAASDAYERLI